MHVRLPVTLNMSGMAMVNDGRLVAADPDHCVCAVMVTNAGLKCVNGLYLLATNSLPHNSAVYEHWEDEHEHNDHNCHRIQWDMEHHCWTICKGWNAYYRGPRGMEPVNDRIPQWKVIELEAISKVNPTFPYLTMLTTVYV